MKFQPSGRIPLRTAFAIALAIQGCLALGETTTATSGDAGSDAMKRLEWLKSRTPPPTPPPAQRRASFRTSVNRSPGLRVPEARPPIARSVDSPAPATRPAETPTPRAAESRPPATESAEEKKPARQNAEAKATPPGKADARPAASSKVAAQPSSKLPAQTKAPALSTPEPRVAAAETREKKSSSTRTESTPATKTAAAATPTPKSIAAASPTPERARNAAASPSPTPRVTLASLQKPAVRITLPEATPTPAPTLTPVRPLEFKTTNHRSGSDSRYPWKTNIVTTVFWVGEPVGGNNFTHNRSSSWDINWAQNFGGFDDPNPAARRRYLPAKFTPRLNPFYIALPYNDVTRGTTKPEARQVIPWFREAFTREGQSVCRDRWVAVRNHAGQVAYAQWSDCGPFRTDHWQYVFGKDRPKPNLNKGAGLDVSPAVRDYLGLDGTDLCDWKFVDVKDVPTGPWALHGENNHFTQKRKPSSFARNP